MPTDYRAPETNLGPLVDVGLLEVIYDSHAFMEHMCIIIGTLIFYHNGPV